MLFKNGNSKSSLLVNRYLIEPLFVFKDQNFWIGKS